MAGTDFALVPSHDALEFLAPAHHTHLMPDTPTLKSLFFSSDVYTSKNKKGKINKIKRCEENE